MNLIIFHLLKDYNSKYTEKVLISTYKFKFDNY